MYEKLLSPAKFGPWDLSSHIVMPPLTRNRAEADYSPNDRAPEYYGQRNTAGLVICEATQVSPEATGYPRTPGIWTQKQTAKWTEVVDAIHAGGAKAVLQLWHCGRIGHPDNQPEGCFPMGPSAVRPGLPIYTDTAQDVVENPVPREMDEDDILGVIESYRKACENAKAAGFDGVELHAANGYLVDQFASTNTNLRTDKWGGDLEARLLFMREVLKAMASVFTAECVGVRMSPYGTFNDIQDADPNAKYEGMLKVCEEFGVGYVHIIRPVVSGNIQLEASGRDVEVIDTARRLFSGPLIAAAGYTPESAEKELREGRADLVAFGRAFVSNPDLVNRIAEGIPFTEGDPDTYYTPGQTGYTDYLKAS
ncbi:alkene reductase [Mangrovicoccus ximenensis]|uniref:alkene reductase n=1 Tax=Mangrovicoccus ximenensis TaxID=1911570 RepID=UPI000D38E6DC|nr:alkene reductase [Mangrovicoccus ximenensis]